MGGVRNLKEQRRHLFVFQTPHGFFESIRPCPWPGLALEYVIAVLRFILCQAAPGLTPQFWGYLQTGAHWGGFVSFWIIACSVGVMSEVRGSCCCLDACGAPRLPTLVLTCGLRVTSCSPMSKLACDANTISGLSRAVSVSFGGSTGDPAKTAQVRHALPPSASPSSTEGISRA